MINYDKEILSILNEADSKSGLSLRNIVRHVYNITSCDMFHARPYQDVYHDVAKCLHKEVSLRGGLFTKAEKRGYYRLNNQSRKAHQLLLEFESDPLSGLAD